MLTERVHGLGRLLFAALACGALSGCGTLYLVQAASGQWQVMHARRPIETVVADPKTPDNVRATLLDVRAARDFAVAELHLPDNRSYRTYADVKRPFVVWNVVAAPEFSVEPKRWCFPIAGCVAYRGYFKERGARGFASELAKGGYDVMVEGVPAYSTLGKLADPVLSTMLRYGDDELVAIIFHELAHQLIYVENDSEFNEAFATVVEDAGLERWLKLHGAGDQLRDLTQEDAQDREFVDVFSAARQQLAQLYASGLPPAAMREKKAAAFADLTGRIRALDQRFGARAYESWLDEGLNNAHLASIATYYQCVPGFERLLTEQKGDLQQFYTEVRKLAALPRAKRHERLCHAAGS